MKFYAIVQSEKAKKGQGGNKRLDISLTVGSRDEQIEAGVVCLRDNGDNFVISYIHDREHINLAIIAKGKKQKGDTPIEDLDRDAETRRDIDSMSC